MNVEGRRVCVVNGKGVWVRVMGDCGRGEGVNGIGVCGMRVVADVSVSDCLELLIELFSA